MKGFLLIISTLILLLPPSHGADFMLSGSQAPPAPIIVYQEAPPRTRDAANTLADYIGKICGTRPEVLVGAPGSLPDRALWVGVQPMVKTLFPAIELEFKHPEETLVVVTEKHALIAGRDRWNPAHMETKGRLAMKTNMQQEYGTANAVYSFLQDQLGVRWLWPGEEDIITRNPITLPSCEIRYHPQIRSRSGIFQKLSLGDSKEHAGQIWARHQRVQLDSLELLGGHAFGHWWETYHEEHPDFFALQPDGTRSSHPNPNNTKLCESNPAVWQQWLLEVGQQLKVNPTQRVFNASENDGYDFGHCVCKDCLAKDHPDGEKFTFRWKGKQEQRPALSDRQVTFANTLGRLLKQRYPDQELYVQLHAYGYSRPAPLSVAPDGNVIISSVANFAMRSPREREVPMQQHAAWANKSPHLMWRPNLGNPAGLSWGLPDVAMTQAAEDFRFVADHHGIGVFFDLIWFHWSTQGPHYYALAHLAWNPYADVEAIMDDYYQRGFGPAAEEVKAYWKLLEQSRMDFVAAEPSRQRAFDLPEKYTPELLAKVETHLDAAAAKLGNADDKYRRRLAFVRCGLELTKLVVDTRAWMQKYEATKSKDAQAKSKVLANWKRAEQMEKDFPEYAINWRSIFQVPKAGAETSKRIIGLHPGSPLSGRMLRELRSSGLE